MMRHEPDSALTWQAMYRLESASRRYIPAADASNSRLPSHRLYWKVMFHVKTGSFNESRSPSRWNTFDRKLLGATLIYRSPW